MPAPASAHSAQPRHESNESKLNRAEEISQLVDSVKELLVPFIRAADEDATALATKKHDIQILNTGPKVIQTGCHGPRELSALLSLSLPTTGLGSSDLASTVSSILKYSVNTSSPGFLDKLYSSPSPPGIAAELILATINNNAHVYNVSPALTCVEKHVGTALANLFGLSGPHAGGVTVSGGAAANSTALLVARNVRFPDLKENGLASLKRPLAIFISEAAHYSAMSAAQILGIGSKYVRKVATTEVGSMDPVALEAEIESAIKTGYIPFFVAGTAGTTVRGAYDPLASIGEIAHKYGAWFHVDASWGGAVAFSEKLRHKILGSDLADSVAFNPHKMLGVPMTCSFLLGRDLRTFWYANRLVAGYLFHNDVEDVDTITLGRPANSNLDQAKAAPSEEIDPLKADWRSYPALANAPNSDSVLDLASLTPQCGRRPDALKLYLHWRYYGKREISWHVENAFEAAHYLALLISKQASLDLIGGTEIPCCQVCFYHNAGNAVSSGPSEVGDARRNSYLTRNIVKGLQLRGWMVDYASGTGKEYERGDFLRVVCNRTTNKGVAEALVRAVVDTGKHIVDEMDGSKARNPIQS